MSLFQADGSKLALEAADALRARAQRIRSASEGEHAPSDARLGPQVITHELLVAARDAVAAVASQSPKLSGKAQQRLLAWTLADAMVPDRAIDRALAETVGKRLEKQAAKVTGLLEAAASHAEQARQDAHHAIALAELARCEPSNADIINALPAKLASIDTAEGECLDAINLEVYIGFHELGLSTPDPTSSANPVVPPPTPPPPPALPPPEPTSHPDNELLDEFDRWKREEPLGEFPQVLIRRLGEHGCTEVRSWMTGGEMSGADVMDVSLPILVGHLLRERAQLSEFHAMDLAELRKAHTEECASLREMRETANERCDAACESEDAACKECEELRKQVAVLQGREDALRELLKSCMRD